MVLLYRHAKTASTEIYAGLRHGFWLPHCVQTAVYLSARMSESAANHIGPAGGCGLCRAMSPMCSLRTAVRCYITIIYVHIGDFLLAMEHPFRL